MSSMGMKTTCNDKCSGFICGVREAADEQDAPRAIFHDKKQEGPVRTENGRLAGRLGYFHRQCRGGGGFAGSVSSGWAGAMSRRMVSKTTLNCASYFLSIAASFLASPACEW